MQVATSQFIKPDCRDGKGKREGLSPLLESVVIVDTMRGVSNKGNLDVLCMFIELNDSTGKQGDKLVGANFDVMKVNGCFQITLKTESKDTSLQPTRLPVEVQYFVVHISPRYHIHRQVHLRELHFACTIGHHPV